MPHHLHYNVESITDPMILAGINDTNIDAPAFIGQGWTKHVGSDSYGGYIVAMKKVGRKTIWGLAEADSKMRGDWTEGVMDCSLPNGKSRPEDCTPTQWVIESGIWKDTGSPKLFFCDENGKKFNGRKCSYSWNGAYAFRDPSF